jgi:hypothetical protein
LASKQDCRFKVFPSAVTGQWATALVVDGIPKLIVALSDRSVAAAAIARICTKRMREDKKGRLWQQWIGETISTFPSPDNHAQLLHDVQGRVAGKHI